MAGKQTRSEIEYYNLYKSVEARIENENISDVELKVILKSFPQLVDQCGLFKTSCLKFRLDYIECFLNAGIQTDTILKSEFQKALFEASQKFLSNKKNYAFNKSFLTEEVSERFCEIDLLIKNYLKQKRKIVKH